MAVKKKPAVKKTAAKKKPAVKKTATKKTVAKKRTVKKTVAKKSVVKKSAVKKTAKKAVKKSAAKKRSASASSIVIPPVPTSVGAGRVDVSSTPKSVARNTVAPAQASKPKEAPKQGASGKVLVAIIVAIIVLAVIVVTRPDGDSDDAAPTPVASATATPTEEATEEATEEPAVEPTEGVTSAPVESVEGPATVGNWKDSAKSVMSISWKTPEASAGLTGYKVEIRVNRGEWVVKSEVPADQLSIDFSKTSATGETSFRVSSIYSDGQEAVGNTFGFSGVFE